MLIGCRNKLGWPLLLYAKIFAWVFGFEAEFEKAKEAKKQEHKQQLDELKEVLRMKDTSTHYSVSLVVVNSSLAQGSSSLSYAAGERDAGQY